MSLAQASDHVNLRDQAAAEETEKLDFPTFFSKKAWLSKDQVCPNIDPLTDLDVKAWSTSLLSVSLVLSLGSKVGKVI